jgi:hypothetical protein
MKMVATYFHELSLGGIRPWDVIQDLVRIAFVPVAI